MVSECQEHARYTVKDPANPTQFIVPPTEPATLTLLSQGNIRRIGTNGEVIGPGPLPWAKDKDKDTDKEKDKEDGTGGQLLPTQSARFVHAFEVWHRNRTLCALHNSWHELLMQCQRIDDDRVNWTLPISSFVSAQQCESPRGIGDGGLAAHPKSAGLLS